VITLAKNSRALNTQVHNFGHSHRVRPLDEPDKLRPWVCVQRGTTKEHREPWCLIHIAHLGKIQCFWQNFKSKNNTLKEFFFAYNFD
jgi:hypothetical protein